MYVLTSFGSSTFTQYDLQKIKKFGGSSEQLAQKIHNRQEYISRIESGKSDIRLSTLPKVMRILNFKLQAVREER